MYFMYIYCFIQYVWLWGVGQETLDTERIVKAVQDLRKNVDVKEVGNTSTDHVRFVEFLTRIQPPYPKDTRLGT